MQRPTQQSANHVQVAQDANDSSSTVAFQLVAIWLQTAGHVLLQGIAHAAASHRGSCAANQGM
jgi:hypothetical protein